MSDTETVVFGPSKDEPRVHVHVQEDGGEVVLYFADLSGEGEVLGLEINPRRVLSSLKVTDHRKVKRAEERIDPAIVRRVGRNYATYVIYARAVIQWDREKTQETLADLRKTGKTKRGLSIDFLGEISREYRAMEAAGERYPVKALAEKHHVVISAASRWLKAARERGLLETDGRPDKRGASLTGSASGGGNG